MGEYAHSVDAKGRVIMPAKFRDELGTSFVVTRGLEGCLSVYTQEGWARFATGMQKLQASKENVRAFKRFLFGSAAELEFDKQGRILLPQVLREFAGLEKEVVMVGVANRVEIWSKERWQECIDSYDDDMDEVAENMESLGFSI